MGTFSIFSHLFGMTFVQVRHLSYITLRLQRYEEKMIYARGEVKKVKKRMFFMVPMSLKRCNLRHTVIYGERMSRIAAKGNRGSDNRRA